MNEEFATELLALLKEQQALLKEQQALLQAYMAAVHSILENHPNLDVIANDFMLRMDNFAMATSPERLAEVRGPWQVILRSMTDELVRRKSLSTD